MKDLTDEFKNACRSSYPNSTPEIDSKRCSSDKFDGIDYTIRGEYIDLRAIINVVAETDGYAIEQFSFCGRAHGEPAVVIFVAKIPQQQHPAFVN